MLIPVPGITCHINFGIDNQYFGIVGTDCVVHSVSRSSTHSIHRVKRLTK